jgi:hypothetical protein
VPGLTCLVDRDFMENVCFVRCGFQAMSKESEDQHSDKEAERCFQEALRGGLSTSPKPLKTFQTATDKRRARRKKNND